MIADDLEKLRAVACKLGLADAVNARQLDERRGLAPRHVEQAAVGQNDVGRHGLRPRKCGAAGAQRMKQRLI